jgi:L-ascorbate metabolism protein UlaG (beta-lactamase superfamily)
MHARRVAPAPPEDLLEGLNAVLVSHLHMDHLDFPSLRGLDRRVPFVVTAGGGRVLRRRGFRDVTEVDAGDEIALGPVHLEVTDARHDGRRWPLGPQVDALGFLLRGSGAGVYFAGDTDLYDAMADLAGRVDVALLPIGGWGPRVGVGHLDGRRAAQAAAMIRPRVVVPIHWGTYQRVDLVGRRPDLLSDPPRGLVAQAAKLAPDVDVRVLNPGESTALA